MHHESAAYLIKIADGDEGYSIALRLAVPYGYGRQAVLSIGTRAKLSGTGQQVHGYEGTDVKNRVLSSYPCL